ncbi:MULTISPECIES: hydrogenase maturation nickel metallochaperone HypA [Spirulina sp. CCY15215]|uniref:hydrogenase maturation nickel metallochaperone HypA n=1 Tax=Spirulina sp. CCY15215 TaxID=2767591 RepID=UPI00194ED9D4|nr:hydrogenase maturation nickel metallochaperone HypA [Spirulina major]
MHEVSLMEQTLEIAIAYAQEQNATRIHHLKMQIGEISGVVPDALNFAFDVVTRGTIAEGATLKIEMVSILCHCPDCDRNFHPVDTYIYECPDCQHLSAKIVSGREIELSSLEVS